MGKSRGKVSTWNQSFSLQKFEHSPFGRWIGLMSKKLGMVFTAFNINGSYLEMQTLYENIFGLQKLRNEYVIMG